MSLKPPLPPNTLLDYRHVYDEGTQQTAEDGINFTGAGVTVTDDPTNHRLVVTIPGGAVGTGDEPYTVVDGLSATPRSVTDWGPLLNTAIASGIRRFLFGAFDYPYATQIVTLHGTGGVTFQGAAPGWTWNDPGQDGRTRLIWNGTGATAAIDCTHTLNASSFEDIHFLYSSNLFTGVMIDFFQSAVATLKRCTFGSVNNLLTSAKAAISLNEIVESRIENCSFLQDYQVPVRGRESGVGNYSNGAYFDSCLFNGGSLAMVMNPGLDWVFTNCTFEFPGLGAGKPAIGQDFDYGGDFATDGAQLSIYDASWWDAQGTAQYAVQTRAGTQVEFSAFNCKEHNTVGSLAYLYDLKSHGNVVISGGDCFNKINVGDASVAAQKKGLIEIRGLDCERGTDVNTIEGHKSGHHTVNVSIGWTSSLLGVSGQAVTLHHERAHRIDQPSVAAHAGVLNHDFTIVGSDMAGMLILHNSGGGVGATGLLADVTLAAAPASPGFGASVAAGTEFVLAEVWPLTIDDLGNNWVTPNMASTYACQPYAYSKTLARGGSQSTFSIGVNVGIPAGGYIGVGYRVIHL